ncbi:MAG: hypothetical protein J6S67_17255 [Methanobrevibacter sp.]|nr:hypothetical protein [Methanobrevibacter sp.]
MKLKEKILSRVIQSQAKRIRRFTKNMNGSLLEKFGVPLDKLMDTSDTVKNDESYTIINLTRSRIILYTSEKGIPVTAMLLMPFGVEGCATTIPGSLLNLMPNRILWNKGMIAVLSAPGLDTSFLANCVKAGTKNPWIPPFFEEDDYKEKTLAESVMSVGTVISPEKMNKITEPLADSLNSALDDSDLNPHNGEVQKLNGDFEINSLR